MWRSGSSGVVLLIRFALCRGKDGSAPARRLCLERGDIPHPLLREEGSFGDEACCLWILRLYDLDGSLTTTRNVLYDVCYHVKILNKCNKTLV